MKQNETPALFNQGMPLSLRFVLLASLAAGLILVDSKLPVLDSLRGTLHLVTEPIRKVANLPVSLSEKAAPYLREKDELVSENEKLRRQIDQLTLRAAAADQLRDQNAQLLRQVQAIRKAAVPSALALIRGVADDKFSVRLMLEAGYRSGVAQGMPVYNAQGILGQVWRVYPDTCEVAPLTFKDLRLPVLLARTRLRGIIRGTGIPNEVELTLPAGSGSAQPGDWVLTSGIDGVFPPGFAVGRVSGIDPNSGRISVRPSANAAFGSSALIALVNPTPVKPPAEQASPSRRGGSR